MTDTLYRVVFEGGPMTDTLYRVVSNEPGRPPFVAPTWDVAHVAAWALAEDGWEVLIELVEDGRATMIRAIHPDQAEARLLKLMGLRIQPKDGSDLI